MRKNGMELPRWLLFGAALVVLAASGLLQVFWIDKEPETLEMFAANPFETMPHSDVMANYILTNLLGGFKAIAVNVLWMQFLELKNREEFVGILPLLDLIAKLQPTLEEVWKHLAWEEAYNLANLASTPEEKLQWIREGLKHIREGCKRNPKSWRLAWQVAYMYWHRVPQDMGVMEQIEKEEGKDPYETALEWFLKAEELARETDKERLAQFGGTSADAQEHAKFGNNTTGFMMVTYAQHLARLIQKGRYDEALKKLDDAIALCNRLISEEVGIGTVHTDRRDSLVDSRPIFELEKKHAAAMTGNLPEREQLRKELIDGYVTIIRKYNNLDLDYCAFRLKYMLVVGLSDMYQLIREGKTEAARQLVGKVEDRARFVLPKEHRDSYFWEATASEIAEFGKVVIPAEAELLRRETANNAAGAQALGSELVAFYSHIFEKSTWQTPVIVNRRDELVKKYCTPGE